MRTKEKWKDILGYKGVYVVSNLGRIKRITTHCGTKIDKLLHPGSISPNYPLASLSKNGIVCCRTIAHWVLLSFKGRPSKYQVPCHINGDFNNNKLNNLYWGTKSEIRKSVPNEIYPRGTKCNRAKLNNADVKAIKKSLVSGMPKQILAEKFNVSRKCIINIGLNKTWKHISI